jgi:hypothetical protein
MEDHTPVATLWDLRKVLEKKLIPAIPEKRLRKTAMLI